MQVGSLVKLAYKGHFTQRKEDPLVTFPQCDHIYTVRNFRIDSAGRTGITVEEIKNPDFASLPGVEINFEAKAFIEVQPPMNVSALFQDQLKVLE